MCQSHCGSELALQNVRELSRAADNTKSKDLGNTFRKEQLEPPPWKGVSMSEQRPRSIEDSPQGRSALGLNTYGGSIIRIYEDPPHRADNDLFDYAAVYSRFDLCTKIQAGLVDAKPSRIWQ